MVSLRGHVLHAATQQNVCAEWRALESYLEAIWLMHHAYDDKNRDFNATRLIYVAFGALCLTDAASRALHLASFLCLSCIVPNCFLIIECAWCRSAS